VSKRPRKTEGGGYGEEHAAVEWSGWLDFDELARGPKAFGRADGSFVA
jgi:hypothetical protein